MKKQLDRMRVPSDNPLRTTADTDVPRNKKGQLRREVGRANTEEAVLETFPREQLLVVCPWPPWFASPGNVIFRLDDLTGIAQDDDEHLKNLCTRLTSWRDDLV